jgi:hypothetical protein
VARRWHRQSIGSPPTSSIDRTNALVLPSISATTRRRANSTAKCLGCGRVDARRTSTTVIATATPTSIAATITALRASSNMYEIGIERIAAKRRHCQWSSLSLNRAPQSFSSAVFTGSVQQMPELLLLRPQVPRRRLVRGDNAGNALSHLNPGVLERRDLVGIVR